MLDKFLNDDSTAIMCVLSPVMSMFRTGNPDDGTVEADREEQ